MNRFRKILFYVGWAGNLLTCILATCVLLFSLWLIIKSLWNDQSLDFADTSAAFLMVVYTSIVAWDTLKWLKRPKRQSAFDFIIYWLLCPFLLVILLMVAMTGFDFIGAQ